MNNSNFSIYTNITSGYERSDFTIDTLFQPKEFQGIPGADLHIEITGITALNGGATPKYLYITKGMEGKEILDWVKLENGRGTLEIQTGDTDTSFSLVATSTQPSTTTTN